MELPTANAAQANDRGLAAYAAGHFDRAIAEFNAALNIDDKFATAYLNRGIALLQKRLFEHAIQDITWALHLGVPPEHVTIGREVRAAAAMGLGRFENALFDLDPLAADSPDVGRIQLMRGIALFRSKRFADAVAALKTALACVLEDRQSTSTHVALAWSRIALADLAAAFTDVNETVRTQPGAEVMFARGVCLLMGRRYSDALADFTWVLAAAPTHAAAALFAARICACSPDRTLRNGVKAVEIAEHLCHLTAWKDVPAISVLAAAFAEQGDWPSAVNWGQRALALAPADSMCQARLAAFQRGQAISEGLSLIWPVGEIPPWALILPPGL